MVIKSIVVINVCKVWCERKSPDGAQKVVCDVVCDCMTMTMVMCFTWCLTRVYFRQKYFKYPAYLKYF